MTAVPLTLTRISPSDNNRFILGVADFSTAAKLIVDTLASGQMQFFFR